jgi:hypothetical protein
MKRIILLLSVTAMIFSFQDVQSQSLRERIRDKILNDNLEAQAKRDSARAVEEGREPDQTPNTTMDRVYMDALGLTGNVDYESTYNFDAYIQMEMTEYKKNGDVDGQMLYDSYVHKNNADYAMEFNNDDAKSTIIFDSENKAMLILTDSDGEKTGFATSIDPEAFEEDMESYEEENPDVQPLNFRKTGKTKTILGYSCDEYLVEEESSEAHVWLSEKLGKEVRKEWMTNKQTFGALFAQAYALNGMVLEYDLIDKDGRKEMMMQVTKIDLNHNYKVSTDGYTIMSMRQKSEEE